MTLRTTLLLLGAIALVAVYLLSRFGGGRPGARNRRRRSLGRTRGVARWPWQRHTENDDFDTADADLNDVTLADSELPAVGLGDAESLEDDVRILPSLRRDDEALAQSPPAPQQESPKRKQMELAFSDSTALPPPRPSAVEREELLVLYLRTEQGRQLNRNELLAAMTQIGMRFGDMNIYHHYGVGSTPSAVPVFSIANMHEPGHLDVDDPAFTGCQGLAMFLQLPGPCDGPVAAELFLGNAQKLAQLLRLQLLNQEHRPLTAGTIDEMRARAARFGAVDVD
ncbi:MAG: hypothetical protein IT494_05410 [Gammaproteobacteria bacterium]|nr:hypothetical protein [Gammaproteobacteria bacterium]